MPQPTVKVQKVSQQTYVYSSYEVGRSSDAACIHTCTLVLGKCTQCRQLMQVMHVPAVRSAHQT